MPLGSIHPEGQAGSACSPPGSGAGYHLRENGGERGKPMRRFIRRNPIIAILLIIALVVWGTNYISYKEIDTMPPHTTPTYITWDEEQR